MLCQLTTVKSRLGILASDTSDDTILTNAIKAVSGRFASFCNRVFDRTESATFSFNAAFVEIVPNIYPIESVASFALKTNETDGFVTQSGVSYLFRGAEGENVTVSLSGSLGSSNQIGRMTYTGGYVLPGTTPDTGQTALPDELEQAAVEQVAYWYQRRHQLGLVSVSGDGASVKSFAELDLLPSVKSTLQNYKRILL